VENWSREREKKILILATRNRTEQNQTSTFPFLVSLKTFCLQLCPISIFIPCFLFVFSLFKATSFISRLLPPPFPFLPLVLHYLFPNLFLFALMKEAACFSKTFVSTKIHDVTYRQFIIFVYFFFCLTDTCGLNVPPDAWPASRRKPHVGDV